MLDALSPSAAASAKKKGISTTEGPPLLLLSARSCAGNAGH